LTLLSHFAQLLRAARDRFIQVDLQLAGPMLDKQSWLADYGFWDYVTAEDAENRFRRHPEASESEGRPVGGRSACTPLFVLPVAFDDPEAMAPEAVEETVADFVKRWDAALRAGSCFAQVATTEAIQSREYLYLLLWELVHNAYTHARSRDVAISGQIFPPPADATWTQNDSPAPEAAESPIRYAMSATSAGGLDVRRHWMHAHKDSWFLMLTCTDLGAGIAASAKEHGIVEGDGRAIDALAAILGPWKPGYRRDSRTYDVHGLSQVLRVVEEHDGYLFLQSGAGRVEFTRHGSSDDSQSLPPEQVLSGTLFQVLLPLTVQAGGRSAEVRTIPGVITSSPLESDDAELNELLADDLEMAPDPVPAEPARPLDENDLPPLMGEAMTSKADMPGRPADTNDLLETLRRTLDDAPIAPGVRVYTLTIGPYQSKEDLVQDISANPPPGPESEERAPLERFLWGTAVIPVVWPKLDGSNSLVLGLPAEQAWITEDNMFSEEMQMANPAQLLIPLQDLVGQLVNNMRLDPARITFMLFTQAEFLEIVDMIENPEARAVYLREVDPDQSATEMYYRIVNAAVRQKASDIHIQWEGDKGTIKLRLDGVLYQKSVVEDGHAFLSLVTKIKTQATMDIIERRRPQDGRIEFDRDEVAEYPVLAGYSLRVSTIPTIQYEKVVMRLLHGAKAMKFDIAELKFPPKIVKGLRELLSTPHGILLVTGPTGSGKTTTLYAALNLLNDGTRNISTVEDPVEMPIPGLAQVQVQEGIGRTFAVMLRALMRQDPDVILIGEIRDEETARIAVQAAKTGHLVLSTIHTNDAVGTIARLRNLGIKDSELGDTVKGVLAQRLVAVLCPECAETYDAARELNEILEEDRFTVGIYVRRARSGASASCRTCRGTGYVGRVPVGELWIPGIAGARILRSGRYDEISLLDAATAGRDAMEPMMNCALRLVRDGRTSLDECISSVCSINDMRSAADVVVEIFSRPGHLG
jgi:general secretion pathway protein E